MAGSKIRLLLLALLPTLAGCVVGVEYPFQPERDDSLVGAWRLDDERDKAYLYVQAKEDGSYRAVMVDETQVMRFGFLLSRAESGTYVNMDLSTVVMIPHRSSTIETLKRESPAYFLFLYRKDNSRVILFPMDQAKLLRAFEARTGLGRIRGRCPAPDSLFLVPRGEVANEQADGHVCVLTASGPSAFEAYLQAEHASVFETDRNGIVFERIQ